jgi:hypothetical protein
MLVNANIKSKKELAQRLIDGEVFYTESGIKVFYDEIQDSTPFRLGIYNLVGDVWESYSSLFKEVNWWDNIPEEGVLCWVDDCDREPKRVAALITSKECGGYRSVGGSRWTYARPVKPEECLQL